MSAEFDVFADYSSRLRGWLDPQIPLMTQMRLKLWGVVGKSWGRARAHRSPLSIEHPRKLRSLWIQRPGFSRGGPMIRRAAVGCTPLLARVDS